MVEEHKRIEQIAKGDNFDAKHNGEWQAPELVETSNPGTLIGKMVIDGTKLQKVPKKVLLTVVTSFMSGRNNGCDELILQPNQVVLLDHHIFGHHKKVVEHQRDH